MYLASWYTDNARVLNLFLLVGVIAALTANMVLRWRKMNRRTRRILSWIYLIFLNFVYGYTITIQDHRPFNLSVLIASVLLSGLLVALLWHPAGDNDRLFYDNSIGSKILFSIERRVRATQARQNKENRMTQTPGTEPEDEMVDAAVDGYVDPPTDLPPEPGVVTDEDHGVPGDEEPLPDNDVDDEEGTDL